MPRPIVIAYHLIWTAYGWWLPNDPRGSTSRRVASDVLAELGELHYGRRKIQPPRRVVREFYDRAGEVLKFALLELSAADVQAVAEGFSDAIARERYTCYACAILPDHVHVLIRKHKHQAEQMIEVLQSASRLRLSTLGLRTPDHPVWATGGLEGVPGPPRRSSSENPLHRAEPHQTSFAGPMLEFCQTVRRLAVPSWTQSQLPIRETLITRFRGVIPIS